MKKIFLTLGFFAIFLGFTMAQETIKVAELEMKKAAETPTSGAQMNFESLVMDYGEIPKGGEPLRRFRFTNDGTEPLVIKSAKGSCGCTVPDYPKEPVLPGEEATIDVRYDTQRVGQFTKTVTLMTNINDEKIILTIKGKVLPEVQEESVPEKEKSIF